MSSPIAPARGIAMPPLPALGDVGTTPEAIAAALRRVHAESVRYWDAYAVAEFFRRPEPDVWAPVDQVRHLTKSMRAVAQGLRVPKPILLLLFGWPRRPSRSLDALRTEYEAALAAGGKAGRYAPRALAPDQHGEAGRRATMTRHAAAVDELAAAIERWPECALDRHRLPHPLLGKLTVREMLLFTLLHDVHHVRVAERRRRELAGLPGRIA